MSSVKRQNLKKCNKYIYDILGCVNLSCVRTNNKIITPLIFKHNTAQICLKITPHNICTTWVSTSLKFHHIALALHNTSHGLALILNLLLITLAPHKTSHGLPLSINVHHHNYVHTAEVL